MQSCDRCSAALGVLPLLRRDGPRLHCLHRRRCEERRSLSSGGGIGTWPRPHRGSWVKPHRVQNLEPGQKRRKPLPVSLRCLHVVVLCAGVWIHRHLPDGRQSVDVLQRHLWLSSDRYVPAPGPTSGDGFIFLFLLLELKTMCG